MKTKTGLFLLVSILAGATTANAIDIKITTKGEQLAFEPNHFEVKAGEKVNLTFTNGSKSMEHNLVIGKPGTAEKIGTDSQTAGAGAGWTSSGPEVLFKTKMLKPTKKEKISFTAPSDKGSYPFLCTFPGHPMFMKGTMTVQ